MEAEKVLREIKPGRQIKRVYAAEIKDLSWKSSESGNYDLDIGKGVFTLQKGPVYSLSYFPRNGKALNFADKPSPRGVMFFGEEGSSGLYGNMKEALVENCKVFEMAKGLPEEHQTSLEEMLQRLYCTKHGVSLGGFNL